MAELLVGGTAAAATAGTATTAASTALTILSGVATIAGIMGTLGAADANARSFEMSAIETDMQVGQEQLQAQQRQSTMKKELMRVLGENDVAIAAAGIDLSGGVAESSRAQIKDDATRQLGFEREDDELRRAMLKARGRGLRVKAQGTRDASLLSAFGQAAEFGMDVAERG